jgi:hypothetical protein
MFVLFVAPLLLFLLELAESHLIPALLAAGLMVTSFAATIRYAPPWLELSLHAAPPHPMRRPALRYFRMFVGNGDLMQSLARRIDPQWQNPYASRTPQETVGWLASMELMHWAVFAGSIAPIAAAFTFDHRLLGVLYLLANLVYNVAPILVIRDTRRRFLRIVSRSSKITTGHQFYAAE